MIFFTARIIVEDYCFLSASHPHTRGTPRPLTLEVGLVLVQMVYHTAVGQVREGVTQSGQLPVQDSQHLGSIPSKDQVVQSVEGDTL